MADYTGDVIADIPQDADTWISTESGPIWLAPTLLALADPEDAWLGITELHARAVGLRVNFQTDAGGMSADEAFGTYSSSVLAVLGQIATTPPETSNRLLESMSDFGDQYGTLAGLDGPYLSALLGSAGLPDTTQTDRAAALLGDLGLGDVMSGGAQRTTLFDHETKSLSFPEVDRVRESIAGYGHAGRGGSGGRLAGQLEQLARDAGVSRGVISDAKGASDALSRGAAGASTGAGIGAGIGTIILPGLGTELGAGAGAVIGFFAGLFGGHDEAPRPEPSHDHASGDKVVVNNVTVNGNNNTIVIINQQGETKSKEGSSPEPGAGRGSGQCLRPSNPAKCQVGDEGTFESFDLPVWGSGVSLAPTMTPIGSGMATYASQIGDTARFGMPQLPAVDELGAAVTLGMLDQLYEVAVRTELWAPRRRRPAAATTRVAWQDEIAKLRVPADAGRPRVAGAVEEWQQVVAATCVAYGIEPRTPVVTALRRLRAIQRALG